MYREPKVITGGPEVVGQLGKSRDSHKYAYGHALVLAGGPGHGGAARLAARSALRIGAGLVTLACPQSGLAENAARLDAVMVRGLDGAPGLKELLEDPRLNAVCLGPGLGLGVDTQHLVLAALEAPDPSDGPRRAVVLDADALSRFERSPEALFSALQETCVLTPHAGEFRRLFPDIADKLAATAKSGSDYSKVDATREAAARAGCMVLFKGPDTVIAHPDGRASINAASSDRAAPWLATAGSGDVLAGFITGLLARGFSPMVAAETAAWLHVECALEFGPGLIAEDLPETLPKVFRKLGL
ncbi:MAG: NAD(P)H-hydrate dehydratase [Pseudomonadota bacterium]